MTVAPNHLRALPLIDAAFARGQLSYSKVRAMTRVADLTDEATLLQVATYSTAAQLERIYRKLRFAASSAAEVERRRRVTVRYDDDGSVWITAVLPPDEGARVLAAIESGRAAFDRNAGASGRGRRRRRRADSRPGHRIWPGRARPRRRRSCRSACARRLPRAAGRRRGRSLREDAGATSRPRRRADGGGRELLRFRPQAA